MTQDIEAIARGLVNALEEEVKLLESGHADDLDQAIAESFHRVAYNLRKHLQEQGE